jgi:hypothetical protein
MILVHRAWREHLRLRQRILYQRDESFVIFAVGSEKRVENGFNWIPAIQSTIRESAPSLVARLCNNS